MSGERLGGRYILGDEIAAGGMATIHLGAHVGPGGFRRTVAIKRLHASAASDVELVEMLLDEARLAAHIEHTNVVATLEVVKRDNELFVVMEYVSGESVSHLIRAARARSELIPPAIAVAIMVGALHGLHAAHEAATASGEALHIVHRDVSPQNILVGLDGVARVLDFGIAKAMGRLASTSDGQIKGKAAYMSPEQVRGEPVDKRTDIFAAAVVLHELLTSERLFAAQTPAESMARVLAHRVQPPSRSVPTLLPELDAIVMRGLELGADARYPTALAMATALEEALAPATPRVVAEWVDKLSGATLSRRKALLAKMADAGDATIRATPDARRIVDEPSQVGTVLEAPRKTRRTPIALAVLLAASIAGAFAWALVRGERRAVPAPSVSAPVAASVSVSAEAIVQTNVGVDTSVTQATSVAEPPSISAPVRVIATTPHRPHVDAGEQQACGYRMFVDDAGLLKPRWTCP